MTASVLTEINGKWSLLLPEHRAARPEWVTGWERERMDSMHDYLSVAHNPRLFDLGTEEGDLSALYALWMRCGTPLGGEIVMIEPNPRVWPNVAFIWEQNQLPPPRATFAGFAGPERRDGSPDWPDPTIREHGWPSSASGPLIGDHGFLNLCERPDCPVTTIDYLAETVGPPTHITMDCEGSEWQILRGAEQTLLTHKPIVWVSVHPAFMREMYGEEATDLYAWMDALGYRSTLLAVDHEHHVMFFPEGR